LIDGPHSSGWVCSVGLLYGVVLFVSSVCDHCRLRALVWSCWSKLLVLFIVLLYQFSFNFSLINWTYIEAKLLPPFQKHTHTHAAQHKNVTNDSQFSLVYVRVLPG
jgi:hypothetical protein